MKNRGTESAVVSLGAVVACVGVVGRGLWTAGSSGRLGCSHVGVKAVWRVPVSYTAQQVGPQRRARALLAGFFSFLSDLSCFPFPDQ